MLEVRGLTVRHGAFTIVDGLSFHVREGEWLMIVGPPHFLSSSASPSHPSASILPSRFALSQFTICGGSRPITPTLRT